MRKPNRDEGLLALVLAVLAVWTWGVEVDIHGFGALTQLGWLNRTCEIYTVTWTPTTIIKDDYREIRILPSEKDLYQREPYQFDILIGHWGNQDEFEMELHGGYFHDVVKVLIRWPCASATILGPFFSFDHYMGARAFIVSAHLPRVGGASEYGATMHVDWGSVYIPVYAWFTVWERGDCTQFVPLPDGSGEFEREPC